MPPREVRAAREYMVPGFDRHLRPGAEPGPERDVDGDRAPQPRAREVPVHAPRPAGGGCRRIEREPARNPRVIAARTGSPPCRKSIEPVGRKVEDAGERRADARRGKRGPAVERARVGRREPLGVRGVDGHGQGFQDLALGRTRGHTARLPGGRSRVARRVTGARSPDARRRARWPRAARESLPRAAPGPRGRRRTHPAR